MARNPIKHQRAVERKAAKHRQKQRQAALSAHGAGAITATSERGMVRQSGAWPLLEVLVNGDWQDTQDLNQIIVARRAPNGKIVTGIFLVDPACLGVKNAMGRVFSPDEYAQLRDVINGTQRSVPADLDFAAKIITEAIAYARELGFAPHRDYEHARWVLGNANPDACPVPVPVGGPDGKPLYVAGPHDNAAAIIAKLQRKLGSDGFEYVVPIGFDEDLLILDDEFDDEEDDEG